MSKKRFSTQGQMDLVPPIHSLLEKGVPSIPALDTYIGDLDSKLEDNTRKLVIGTKISLFQSDDIYRSGQTTRRVLRVYS